MDSRTAEIVQVVCSACRQGNESTFRMAVVTLREHLVALRPGDTMGPGLAFGTLHPAGDAIGKELLQTEPDWALRQLEMVARDESVAMRSIACRILGFLGTRYPQDVVPCARILADDASWEVREFIANAIDDPMCGAQGDFVFALMQQWVHDELPNVRRAPTNALMRYGRRHPERVIRLMAELLHDDSRYVRDNVVFCLSVMGAVRVQVLGGARSEGNPSLLLAALREWMADDNVETRWIIAKTLGRSWAKACPGEALSLLHELEQDQRKPVRTAVASSMRALELVSRRCTGVTL